MSADLGNTEKPPRPTPRNTLRSNSNNQQTIEHV